MCDGIQDCVGGTDEVDCGLGKGVGNVDYVFRSH